MCIIHQKSAVAIRKSSSFSCDEKPTGLGMRKTVSFHSVADVCQVSHSYPSDFFYTRSETDRFRREAREERKTSHTAYIEKIADLASSSALVIIFLTVGIIATTITCLPILLGLKFVSVFVADSKNIDASVVSSNVAADTDLSLTERLIYGLLGGKCNDDTRLLRVWELK